MVTFDSTTHTYCLEGRKIPSVTQILSVIAKPQLIQWAANCTAEEFKANLFAGDSITDERIYRIGEQARMAYKRKGKEAAGIGTKVHQFAETFMKRILLGEAADTTYNEMLLARNGEDRFVKNGINSFYKWFKKSSVEPISVERILFNRFAEYAGTVDLLCKIDGELSIVDYKTSKEIYPEYELQLAAYKAAYEFETGNTIKATYIVRFDKFSGDLEVKKYESLSVAYGAFISALQLYDWLERNK